MKRLLLNRRAFLLALFAFGLIEIYSVLPQKHVISIDEPVRHLTGAIHVHSHFSHDGGGSVEEIARAANKQHLDFVVATDHDNRDAADAGKQQRFGNTDVFIESESSLKMGHALTFYGHTRLTKQSAKEVRARAQRHLLGESPMRKDVFHVIAHPLHPRRLWSRLDLLADGVEVLNFDSLWRLQLQNRPLTLFATALSIPFNNYLGALRFFRFDRKHFEIWDHMNTISKGHFGILAHDTHQNIPITKSFSLGWPRYEEMFGLGSNVVFFDSPIPKDFPSRQKALYRNLRKGKAAMLFQYIHPFSTNSWQISCKDRVVGSGETIALKPNCEHQITLPKTLPFPATIQFWRDGELDAKLEANSAVVTLPITRTGAHRVEIWVNPVSRFGLALKSEVPYLFYNPIYVE